VGVLEPEGLVEIKMRRDKILKLMERLDPVFATLKKESTDQSKTAEERAAAVEKLAAREKHLEPSYKQAALLYADLHDRTGRMEAKGCAKRMEWTNARRHFYWAVRGRVARSSALGKLAEADPSLTFDQRREILEDSLSLDSGASPQAVAEACEAIDLKQTISKLKSEHLLGKLLALAEEDKQATVDGLTKLISGLGEDTKSALLSALRS